MKTQLCRDKCRGRPIECRDSAHGEPIQCRDMESVASRWLPRGELSSIGPHENESRHRDQRVLRARLKRASRHDHDRRRMLPQPTAEIMSSWARPLTRKAMTERRRIVRCPRCQHEGAIAKSVPTTASLKCTACGAGMLVREATGERPCRWKDKPAVKDEKAARAADVLARYAPIPDGGDDLSDLW